MNQRNVPGIDAAYLAMDAEEGVEVVWNEVMISERKNFKLLEVSLHIWTKAVEDGCYCSLSFSDFKSEYTFKHRIVSEDVIILFSTLM